MVCEWHAHFTTNRPVFVCVALTPYRSGFISLLEALTVSPPPHTSLWPERLSPSESQVTLGTVGRIGRGGVLPEWASSDVSLLRVLCSRAVVVSLTQDDSVWLLSSSSSTMQALPVNTNKPASVSEDPRRLPPSPKRSSSLFRRRAALPVHNHMGRGQNMGEKHVWKCDFSRLNVDDCFISCFSLSSCSLGGCLHIRSSPRSHFTLVSQLGSSVLRIQCGGVMTADWHTHTHTHCQPCGALRLRVELRIIYYSPVCESICWSCAAVCGCGRTLEC